MSISTKNFKKILTVKMDGDDLEFQPSEQDLKHLREWIAKSPHILQDYDDKFLSAFVRGCKGRLQKTKTVLEAFNNLGQKYPEIMKNYDPLDQRLLDHLSQTFLVVLPKKSPDGCTVYLTAFRTYEGFKSEPYRSHNTDVVRYAVLSLYALIWRNEFENGKFIIIMDCKGMTLTNGREATPVMLKQWIEIMQHAIPIRLQAVHVINIPTFLGYVCNFLKSVAKKKIAERMHFHSTMETFYEKIPKEIFPEEYGGKEESCLILNERWFKTVLSYRKQLLEEESKMRKLDQVRPKTNDEEEMVGTFKALKVD